MSLYYHHFKMFPSKRVIDEVVDASENISFQRGESAAVLSRVASTREATYVFLSDDSWRAAHIDASGWKLTSTYPVKFWRPRGAQALPQPVHGGSIDELFEFINVADEDARLLLVAWMIYALCGERSFPVLWLYGEQGSAKSTTTKMIRALLDPARPDVRAEPKDARDLAIAARTNWILAYDNLSYIPAWLSDALCRMSTGGGFATRELYSDAEETLFEAMRPIILNGITEVVSRPDLLDRTVSIRLDAVSDESRKSETGLWSAFDAARPRILGALFDLTARTLGELPNVKLERTPRMADFARVGVAVERALGVSPCFLAVYNAVRQVGVDQAIEASPIGAAFVKFSEAELAKGTWTGTSDQLLLRLSAHETFERIRGNRYWPANARALSGELRRLAPNLRSLGISIIFPGTGAKRGSGGQRILTIDRMR
jgi:hypothetical protein